MGGRVCARRSRGLIALSLLVSLTALTGFIPRAEAGSNGRRSGRVLVPTADVCPAPMVSPGPLGSGFSRTPYMVVRGNLPTGGGFTPFNFYGDGSMALYGPTSPLRMTSAPVYTYTRGYDGRTVAVPATSFSTPNLPRLTPVIYPTQGSTFSGFRQSGSPASWQNAQDWIDQN
jgi:hypothetical protein